MASSGSGRLCCIVAIKKAKLSRSCEEFSITLVLTRQGQEGCSVDEKFVVEAKNHCLEHLLGVSPWRLIVQLKELHISDNGILQALSAKLVGQYALVSTETCGTVTRGTNLYLLTDIQLVPDNCSTILSYPPFCCPLQTPQFERKCQPSRHKLFPGVMQDSFNTSTPRGTSNPSFPLYQLHSLDDSFVNDMQQDLDQELCSSSQELKADHASFFGCNSKSAPLQEHKHSTNLPSIASPECSWEYWNDVPNPSFFHIEDSVLGGVHGCFTETTLGNKNDRDIPLAYKAQLQSCCNSMPSYPKKPHNTSSYYCSARGGSQSNWCSTPIRSLNHSNNRLCLDRHPPYSSMDRVKSTGGDLIAAVTSSAVLVGSEQTSTVTCHSVDQTSTVTCHSVDQTSTVTCHSVDQTSTVTCHSVDQTSTVTCHSADQTSNVTCHSVDQTSTGTCHTTDQNNIVTPELFRDEHTNDSNSLELFPEPSTPIYGHLRPTMLVMTPELF